MMTIPVNNISYRSFTNRILPVVFFFFLFHSKSLSADIGLPVFKSTFAKSASIDVYYEKMTRDVLMSPDGFKPSVGEQDESRFMGRLNFHSSTKTAIYFEGGLTDSENSNGEALVVGGGLKYLVLNDTHYNLVTIGSLSYAHEITYSRDGFIDYANQREYPGIWQEESYIDTSIGLILSSTVQLDSSVTSLIYAGAVYSHLNGDVDYEINLASRGGFSSFSGSIESEDDFGGVAGIGLYINNDVGLRVESRFGNQSSISFGLNWLF